MEMLVSGINQENTNIFIPNWEDKTLLAQSRTSWPDARKLHFYGRNAVYTWLTDVRYRQAGTDTHGSYNNICYMINNWSVMSYGSTIPWLSRCRNLELTRNYNGDLITDIGMIKVETETDGDNWLYYSWRVWTTCGVDRINLDKVSAPDTYATSGYFFTQKFNYWDAKASINKVKMRAYTTATQTIKIYCSVDWWAWELKQILNGTDPKKYFAIDSNVQGYTVQWKIELDTNNEDETPVLYAFSFNYSIWDNE
jgi:hypothetical protein